MRESLEDINFLKSIDLRGTGAAGSEAVARAVIDNIPSESELLSKFRGGGQNRIDAQELLAIRSEATQTLRDANEKKFNDFIENQKFIELNRRDAEERVKNLGERGSGLNDKDQLDKYLNIVNELGDSELTPQLRQGKIRVLNARAELEAEERKKAEEFNASLKILMNTVQEQLDATGLKVTLGETPIVNLSINASGVQAQIEQRPSSSRTR